MFQKVTITDEIKREFGNELPDWILIENPVNSNYQKILSATLDNGEASAIALAVELSNCLLIIDELKGRRIAQKLGIRMTGTLGIIIRAKLAGIIPSIKPILKKIKSTDFRISERLEQRALQLANE